MISIHLHRQQLEGALTPAKIRLANSIGRLTSFRPAFFRQLVFPIVTSILIKKVKF